MRDAIKPTSACYAREPIDGQHTLREAALCGKVNIRGDASDSRFVESINSVLKLDLPVTAHSLNEQGPIRMFWLGPDEWLLHCDLNDVDDLLTRLKAAFSELHAAVTDVSDYYTILELHGPQAEALIRNGSPLDIHHSVFRNGDFAQTRFGHASILLHKLGDGLSWNIQVRWTYAEYVWDYLASGMETLQR